MTIIITYTIFFLGIVMLVAAAGAALGYLWGPNNDRLLRLAARATFAGAVCLFITSWLRLLAWHVVPVMSGADSLNLFVMLVAITAFAVCAKPRRQALLSFYLPPLALIALLCAMLAVQEFRQPPAEKEFSRLFLVIHVSMAFLAYALFFVASMTSAAYAFQARRLKNRQTTGLFQKLPSLENLDHTLFRLIKIGYPLFAITLVLGLLYAWKTPDPLSSTWWLSPKILLSLVMVLLYGGSYHARALGLLRGPKLAYLVFGGFTVLLVTYLVMVVLQVTNYNFYGTA